MAESNAIQQEIIAISQDYLGPASERFINRQIEAHLKKKASEITHKDLVKLVDWIRLAFSLLTNDSHLVDEYANRLLKITKNKVAET